MKIIENNDDLKVFLKLYKNKDSILIPIFSDENKHPHNTEISLLYVQIENDEFIQSRQMVGKSIHYCRDAAENWIIGVIK